LKVAFFKIQHCGLIGFAENGSKYPPTMQTYVFRVVTYEQCWVNYFSKVIWV